MNKRPTTPESESDVQQEIQLIGPAYGCILERNNSGALPGPEGRPVRFGLGNVSKEHNARMKSADLVGGTQITITPEMVGKSVLIMTGIEVKPPKWYYAGSQREEGQLNWINWIRSRGGIASFAASVKDFEKVINDYIQWLKS